MEAASIGFLVVGAICLWMHWDTMREAVPTRFDFGGDPHGSLRASKAPPLMLPAGAFVAYCTMTIVSCPAHLQNVPAGLPVCVLPAALAFSGRPVNFFILWVLALLGYVEWMMIEVARGNVGGLGPWFVPLVIAGAALATAVPVCWYRRLAASDELR